MNDEADIPEFPGTEEKKENLSQDIRCPARD
jgi:hypothetical protein